jgi:hypothetical protein
MERFNSGIRLRTMATNIIQPMKDALRTSSYRPYGGCRTLSRRALPGFVPEGLNDRSQAIYCLVTVQKGNRPVGHGMIGSNRRATIRTINQPWVRIRPSLRDGFSIESVPGNKLPGCDHSVPSGQSPTVPSLPESTGDCFGRTRTCILAVL